MIWADCGLKSAILPIRFVLGNVLGRGVHAFHVQLLDLLLFGRNSLSRKVTFVTVSDEQEPWPFRFTVSNIGYHFLLLLWELAVEVVRSPFPRLPFFPILGDFFTAWGLTRTEPFRDFLLTLHLRTLLSFVAPYWTGQCKIQEHHVIGLQKRNRNVP